MPPTKNLIWVAVVTGVLYLLLKIFLHFQQQKDTLEPLPLPPEIRGR